MPSPLVTADWLADHLDDPAVRIVEMCSLAEDAAYETAHIPNAIGWFWKALCWHDTDREFVTPAAMAARLGSRGIGPDHTLVLYGDPVQYGTYAYWSLTMAGHKDIRLLDGARKKWLAEGRPVTDLVADFAPVDYPEPVAGDTAMRLGRDEIRANLGKPGRLLLDVRSPEEYSGERVMEYGKFDHGAERGGRIPGARHLFFKAFLNDDDTLKDVDGLRAALNGAGIELQSFDEIVCYCRLSHRATLAWTALTQVLGHDAVKIYDGSWTEWGSIVGFPVER